MKPLSLRPRLVGGLLACLAVGLPVDAEVDLREAAGLDAEVTYVVESCRLRFQEAWEESGSFGGYGDAAMEVAQRELDIEVLRGLAAKEWTSNLDPSTRAAFVTFHETTAGSKAGWLGRELSTREGQKGLVRSARKILDQLPKSRIDALVRADEAMLERATAMSAAASMVDLIGPGAALIASLTGEDIEWDNPELDVKQALRRRASDHAFLRLAYRLNRLSGHELATMIAWAESPSGRVFYATRQAALFAVASEVAAKFLEAQQADLNRELAEYRREAEDDEDESDEDES